MEQPELDPSEARPAPASNAPPRSVRRPRCGRPLVALAAVLALVLHSQAARASTAYGSLNNFDCVNDTGVEAHGFDIEMDDIHSTDITYTYDYNHYGPPRISEDNTDPLHPKVLVRYASARNPDGTWAAYTAVPSGPIAPTQGHQFTDPSVNFGGEHFGVGYYGAPSAVRYYWLIDDGLGNLVHGPPVNVATPTFVLNPPAGAAPANVVAVIVPPAPPAPPALEFGEATWVKAIKTTTHNAGEVHLDDLVAGDPGEPQPWANGEPAEVEVEWRILQTRFAAADGGPNGELAGAPEDLPGGDEVVTRRYEFYRYTGPFDVETGEAMADAVAADGLHGVGSATFVTGFDQASGEPIEEAVDLSVLEVVGEFIGAQMSGFDVAPGLGLVDHLQDGEVDVPYVDRTVVIGGNPPYRATISAGALPSGMGLDEVTGVVSGTPTVGGEFTFTVHGVDSSPVPVDTSRTYTLVIAGAGEPSNVEEWASGLPATFSLEQNHPNPFNSSTVLRFALPARERIELAVFDLAGQRVAVLAEGTREAGTYTVAWDSRDGGGQSLASGVYLCHLRAGAWEQTRRLLLLR